MDATKKPLRIPPEFATYAEKHGIFEMYKRMLEQLVIHKPADPLSFMIEHLKRDNDDGLQIVLLGPPGSGKTASAKKICEKTKAIHITPDLRALADGLQDTGLRNEALQCANEGKPVPNDLWTRVLSHRLSMFDCIKRGWVLDGFPQTREQAQALQAEGVHPKHLVILEASDTVVIERVSTLRQDPQTLEVYNLAFDGPNFPRNLVELAEYSEEAMIDKLVVYHRHIAGILDCFSAVSKPVNADQPKADVAAQVLTYLCGKPRTAAPHTPRVVLLGATGSGKGVQAALMASKYNIVNVSCGQLIKQALADESKAGLACRPYVEKNMMVPDAIVLQILKERLGQLDCVSRGWVLHGYPRTREQAEQLSAAGYLPNRIFFLDVPNDSVIERLTLRATDPITGDRYHLLYNPPRTQELKDRLQVQPKDQDEEVKKRLSQYHAYSEEMADFYEEAQHLNGDQDPHTVFECIESMVVNPLPLRIG